VGKVCGDKLSIGKWIDLDLEKLYTSWGKTIEEFLERK